MTQAWGRPQSALEPAVARINVSPAAMTRIEHWWMPLRRRDHRFARIRCVILRSPFCCLDLFARRQFPEAECAAANSEKLASGILSTRSVCGFPKSLDLLSVGTAIVTYDLGLMKLPFRPMRITPRSIWVI